MKTNQNEWQLREYHRFAREVVLCLAGIFAVGRVKDELMWESARALQRIIVRAGERIRSRNGKEASSVESDFRPHPAFVELLRRLDHDSTQSEVSA